MSENEKQEQQAIDDVVAYASDLLFVQKKSPTEAKHILVRKGLTSDIADVVVDNLTELTQKDNDRANRDMIFGALWFFGGIIITAVTYSAASGGGTYVVTWGAIIFGAIQFFKGLMNRA